MMLYEELLTKLKNIADEKYRLFTKKLLKDESINVLGVTIPKLKAIAKEYKEMVDEVISLPDTYFEVTFIKLQIVALLPYDRFIYYLPECVKRLDNWSSCDSFKAKCIIKHKGEFLSYIYNFAANDKQFYQRYALVCLLQFYIDEEYLNDIFKIIYSVNTQYYYVSMAAAWLIAEVLAKYYDKGVDFLKQNKLDKNTNNRAIQKARESFRLNEEQKKYLNGLKVK
jgi:3-methyladenine DNA glycosylase AlkD